MKPNWKDAPEWANYLAMDASGEHEIHVLFGARNRAERDYWRDSLEQRPKD